MQSYRMAIYVSTYVRGTLHAMNTLHYSYAHARSQKIDTLKNTVASRDAM